MMYTPVIGFLVLSCIYFFQHNIEVMYACLIISSNFFIAATIESVFKKWEQRKILEYKTLSDVFDNWTKDLKEKQKEQQNKEDK